MKSISLIAVFFLLCSAGLLRADSTYMHEVVLGRTVVLPTHGLVDLSAEGAVEFWYRHQGEHSAMKTFAQDKFVDDAYSIVMTLGVGADFKAAIVVGPGVDGTASIGVLNDVSVLGNNEKTRKQIAKLSKADDFGKRDPIEFVKGSTYHILLAKRPGRDDIRIFVNGQLQGTIPATFGKAATTVSLGWDPKAYAPATKPADGDPAEPVVYPFNGFIGGLRFWDFGDFEENDAARLSNFGRLIDLADLTMLPEYGHLIAYGDFVGRRWNASRMVMTTGADPVLRFADPLAGAWITEGAATHQTQTDTSVFDDYPVFTFLPATATLPQKIADRTYNVFEDGNFLGTISPVADNDRELWKLKCHHWSNSDGVVAEHVTVGRERFLRWSVSDMKRESKFAGIASGEVRMKRKSIVDFRIASPSAQRMTPAETAKLKAQNDSLQLVFLYTAYPKLYDRIYRSYNIVKMHPWQLLVTGTATTTPVIRVPEAEQMFKLNLSEQMILPYDLEVMADNLALDSSSTKLVSNASEYNATRTSRIGAGVSGSVTVGTGGMIPVTAQGTVNLNIVVQYESIKDMASSSSDGTEKLLRTKWEKKHTMLHRKEAMRISDEYAMALRTLHGQLSAAPPQARPQLVYNFFDTWGTHYPLAMVFGNIELTEMTVTDRVRTESTSGQSSLEVSVNEGKSGNTEVTKEVKTATSRDGTTIVRSMGDPQSPMPIALDLRPLTDLMTPQQFPEEPHIYTELRAVLATALPHYRNEVIASAVQELKGPEAENAKRVVTELQTPPPPPPPAEILAVRYKGISMDDWKLKAGTTTVTMPTPPQGIDLKLDGTIQFWPYLTGSNDAPLPEHLHAAGLPFLVANPPVDIFAKTAPAEQVRRIKMGTSQGIQPFGDPKNTQMLIRVPGALRDNAFVHVAGWFQTVGSDQKAKGKSLSIDEMLIREMGRAEFPVGKAPLVFPFDMLVADAPTIAGSVLWASEKPVQLPLRKDIMFNEHMTMKKGNKTLLKDRKDEAGEKYVFQYPSNIGGWRQGRAPVVMDFSGNGTMTSTLWIHYEYALLKDFRDAVVQNKNVLPKDAWGSFSPGAKTPEVNLFANRTGVRPSAAPNAPLPPALLDQLKIPPTLQLTSHSLGAPGSTLISRGFGVVEFIPQPAQPCWTFIERTQGEWMIINTLDARALTVAPDGSVVSTTPRDGDTGQLWIPTAVKDGFEFRNKKTGGLLARATDAKNTRAMTVPAAQPNLSTVFSLSPRLDLTKEEGKTFDVVLKSVGDNKIPVIKVVREATGLGLKDAKDLVEGAPKVVKEALPKADAEALKKKLEEQGGIVELKLK